MTPRYRPLLRHFHDRLEDVVADELEGQNLDFKEWDAKSRRHAVAVAVEMAVCMANGGGSEALPLALRRLFDRVAADNPITTVREGIVHFEHRRFPEIAIREALVNAFCHADLRVGGPILVKQSDERLEIGNPGGFIGGTTAENILHHRPVARNPCLVDALVRLRIVNRSNLGVPRMYTICSATQ